MFTFLFLLHCFNVLLLFDIYKDLAINYRFAIGLQLQVQTESESTSPDEVELNSATEISTDSEFDNDEIIRQAPKIFIDDTHLRKPTKVQVMHIKIGTSYEVRNFFKNF